MRPKEGDAYLRAESSLLVKVAVHEGTIFPGCDLTPCRTQAAISNRVNWPHAWCFRLVQDKCVSSPPFGSDAAGSACDGTVYVRQVGVVPCVVPGANLNAGAEEQKSILQVWSQQDAWYCSIGGNNICRQKCETRHTRSCGVWTSHRWFAFKLRFMPSISLYNQ